MNGQPNSTPESDKQQLKIGDLMELLPHRYPMLLLDRVVEIV